MLTISSANTNSAWRETLTRLLREGSDTDNGLYFRDEPVVIELTAPEREEPDALFPMPQHELEVINRFICTGQDEQLVAHEWTKLYYHRMFDEPNCQFDYLLRKVAQSEPAGEAVISLWDKTIDQEQFVSPCTLILWARRKHGKLEFHVHAHSSDAYKKLLMNLQEFVSVQIFLAQKLRLTPGSYYHFLDSCHIHHEDVVACRQLVAQLNLSA